jgi:hypothetical protein
MCSKSKLHSPVIDSGASIAFQTTIVVGKFTLMVTLMAATRAGRMRCAVVSQRRKVVIPTRTDEEGSPFRADDHAIWFV